MATRSGASRTRTTHAVSLSVETPANSRGGALVMLVIVCPNCGPRNDNEFNFLGEVIPRPSVDVDPTTWRRYLYMRGNTSGWQRERWFHVSGCRRFLNIERNNVTNEIRMVAEVGGDTT